MALDSPARLNGQGEAGRVSARAAEASGSPSAGSPSALSRNRASGSAKRAVPAAPIPASVRFEDHLPQRLRDVEALFRRIEGEEPTGARVIDELFSELHALGGVAAVFGYSELGRVAYAMHAALAPHRSAAQVPLDVVQMLRDEVVRLKRAATEPDPHR